jgi:tRNA pseudouridine55 synthase
MPDAMLAPGLILIDKPGLPFPLAGQPTYPPDTTGVDLPTSHDVVQRVRRLSGQRRIGHTGTLDPMAQGLLILCLGQAARLVEYYQGHDKRYLAHISLGFATDTLDAMGEITQRMDVPLLTEDEIESALQGFRGSILQRPPAYSAIKLGGESAHRKARRGEEIEMTARGVTFHEISMVEFAPPDRLLLRVHCSAGAYIRSLAHDLGAALGTAAILSGLRRASVGSFSVDDAHTLDEVAAAARANRLLELLVAPGAGLDLPRLSVDLEAARRLAMGQTIAVGGEDGVTVGMGAESPFPVSSGILAQALDAHGHLLGITRCVQAASAPGESSLWRAEKWFAA